MKDKKKDSDISVYFESKEEVANNYVMKCFSVTMIVYSIAFLLNTVGIFTIEQKLMLQAFLPSCLIYFIVWLLMKTLSSSNPRIKYVILSSIILMFTITGVFITYHVVLVTLLPILYATIYSSKPVMRFVYLMTVVSTIIVVYCGFYFGLCDANMALLTSGSLQTHTSDGHFILTEVNPNPNVSLFLFFVLPRCLIYIAFVSVCNSINNILSSSIEKARLNAELEEAKTSAENANRAKSQFLARMSHEIRTPINAVLGMNEMILRESSEEPIRDYANDIKNSSLHLLSIVNEILDSTKIESGMMEIVPVNYQVGSVLNDLYNMFSLKAEEKGLKLLFDIDENIPTELYGDDKRIKQVLLNLLSNAVKYTQQGEIKLKVTCEAKGDDAILYYSVSDTGIGIKKEDISKIYDVFQRFDLSKNYNVEGTGLGMNIVQQLLKLMESELHIESEYEKGSNFSFVITQKIVDGTPLGNFKERLKSVKPYVYRSNFIAPDAKILVVDDYEINLKVFKGLLKPTKIQIFEAKSGKECLRLMNQDTYNLVFLDHMMPDMDGIQTLHEIRKQNLCKDVPIIMLTANAIVGDRENYIKEGFNDFLSKPILIENLEKIILKYLPQRLILPESGNRQNVTTQVVGTDDRASVNEDVNRGADYSPSDVMNKLRKKLTAIDFEAGLSICSGDVEFYLELLHDFTELPIKEELTGYFNENDCKRYCIRVHGFKNSSYSIGAKSLGDLAFEIEKVTQECFPKELADLQEQLFGLYDNICTQYKEVRMN